MPRGSGARPTPAELEREIEVAQQRLSTTIDEIADRVSPRGIARRGTQGLRDAGSHLVEEVRAVATGAQSVRRDRHIVTPPRGSVTFQGEEEIVSTYEPRRLRTGAILVGVGVGVAAVSVAIWLRRRRR